MDVSHLARSVRRSAGLSLRQLARRADLATSTVHRVERGELHPTVETVERIVTAAGRRLVLEVPADSSGSVLGLGLAVAVAVEADDTSLVVRQAAELVSRFDHASADGRRQMLAVEPSPAGSEEWDAFLAGLAEWLAVRGDVEPPAWTRRPDRFLRRGWWVTPMRSLRAWEYAGTPVSLQRRGVYLHRESLVNR
jgi:transcriptional regulator with XRE-family HTH domain